MLLVLRPIQVQARLMFHQQKSCSLLRQSRIAINQQWYHTKMDQVHMYI